MEQFVLHPRPRLTELDANTPRALELRIVVADSLSLGVVDTEPVRDLVTHALERSSKVVVIKTTGWRDASQEHAARDGRALLVLEHPGDSFALLLDTFCADTEMFAHVEARGCAQRDNDHDATHTAKQMTSAEDDTAIATDNTP